MYTLRTVVLEDEDENRHWIVKKLGQFPEIDLVGEATSVDDAFALIVQTRPDAAFMDIQLIGGDVFSLLQRLQDNDIPIPFIVMTTGYPDYVMSALNDYRRFVVQYLLKPFVEDWQVKFRKSIDALIAAKMNNTRQLAEEKDANSPPVRHSIFINNRGNLLRLEFDKVAYLEAAGGGETFVVTDLETHQVDLTLSKFLELLPEDCFQRISKNNIVNIERILRINREERTMEIRQGVHQKTLGVGEIYYTQLIKNLPIAKAKKPL